MNRRKLKKIKLKLDAFRSRSANIRDRELVSLARSLGRKKFARGKEPTFINEHFQHLRPLSIPSHSRALNRFTAGSILDHLELDILAWEEKLQDEGREDENGA